MSIDFKYHRGAYAPEWFDKTEPNHYDITSGSSPFNEWYAFKNDEDVHELAHGFENQSFIDGFVFVEIRNSFYHVEDAMTYGIDQFKPKENSSPADARSILEAESAF